MINEMTADVFNRLEVCRLAAQGIAATNTGFMGNKDCDDSNVVRAQNIDKQLAVIEKELRALFAETEEEREAACLSLFQIGRAIKGDTDAIHL